MTRHLVSLLLVSGLVTLPAAAEEPPALELLFFLAEFTDEKGNWDAPEWDEAPVTADEKRHLGEKDVE